jgi:hypothetical protein
MRRWMLLFLAISLAVCACSGAGAGVPSPPPNATQLSPADGAAVRQLAFAYWQAFNDYDVQTTLSYLEPTYGASRKASISDEIGQIRTFGVKLGVKEKSAPVALGPDTAEMYMSLSEPLGTRTIRMDFERTSDGWLISFAEEVP